MLFDLLREPTAHGSPHVLEKLSYAVLIRHIFDNGNKIEFVDRYGTPNDDDCKRQQYKAEEKQEKVFYAYGAFDLFETRSGVVAVLDSLLELRVGHVFGR